MCSLFFNYTWTLDVGHEIPATISVCSESIEKARSTVTKHISGLAKSLASIDVHGSTDPRVLDAASTFRGDISRKLCISAAAAVDIPMNEFYEQISPKNIAFALDKLLQVVQPTIKPADAPKFAWDREPVFVHYVPLRL